MKNVIDEVKKYEKEIIKKLDNTGKFFNSTQKYLETYLKKYDSSVGALIKQAKSDYKVLRTSLEKFSKNNNNFSSWNDFLEQTEKKFILKDGETWPNAYPLLSNKFKSDISENYAKLINIEALTMIDMVKKMILPAVTKYSDALAKTILAKQHVVGKRYSPNFQYIHLLILE